MATYVLVGGLWLGGWAWGRVAGANLSVAELRTSHWPMLSRPDDLAALLADLAQHAARRASEERFGRVTEIAGCA